MHGQTQSSPASFEESVSFEHVQICIWEHALQRTLALTFMALSKCARSTPSPEGALKWQHFTVLKTQLKTWVSSQYSAPCFGLSLAGHVPVFQEHVLVKHIISKKPSAQLPDITTSPKDRGAELLHLLPTYQNWFYREGDFYFILIIFKKRIDEKHQNRHSISFGIMDFTYQEPKWDLTAQQRAVRWEVNPQTDRKGKEVWKI